MVLNGLCDPSSKLGVLRWLETVALPAGNGLVSEHQHLLRTMDVLDEHRDKLGKRLATLMCLLVDQDLSVVFYDLPTLAVTGQTDLDDDVRAYGLAKSALIERQFMLCWYKPLRVNDQHQTDLLLSDWDLATIRRA